MSGKNGMKSAVFAFVIVAGLTATASNVRDFGAVGDGVRNDTAAIQRAIDAGGLVHFPPGVYLTGTLYLKSNGGLDLDPGARILGSTRLEDYNKPDFCPQNYGAENKWKTHLIVAVEQTNVVIRGGTIDGNAPGIWAAAPKGFRSCFGGRSVLRDAPWMPAQMIFLAECEHVRVEDSRLVNSGFWNLLLWGSEHVTVRGLHIRSSPHLCGDDGIDIDCCRFVTVSDCQIDVGDDGITIRASANRLLRRKRACEYVSVANCIVRSDYAHAVRVGVGSGTIRHCKLSNLIMNDTRCAIHVNPKYGDAGTGCSISDVTFDNIQATSDMFLFVALDYVGVTTNRFAGVLSDLRFSHLTGTTKLPIVVRGNDIGRIERLRVEDSDFAFLSADGLTDGDRGFFMFDPADAGPRIQTNGTDTVFRNVSFR